MGGAIKKFNYPIGSYTILSKWNAAVEKKRDSPYGSSYLVEGQPLTMLNCVITKNTGQ